MPELNVHTLNPEMASQFSSGAEPPDGIERAGAGERF